MTAVLLDEILPAWQFRSHHTAVVDAPADRVADAVESFRLDRDASPLVRLLFRARGLSFPGGSTLRESLTSAGFSVLAEQPGREIVFGVAGKFWAPCEMANLVRVPDAAAFIAFDAPGQAKGAINIVVDPVAENRTVLRTETRVACTDRRARLFFGAYWSLIRIPSGLIRVDMLRAIVRAAAQAEPAVIVR